MPNAAQLSSPPQQRLKQATQQQASKRTYELHNLTQSSSLIDHLIKATGARSPHRAESIAFAKQASAMLVNRLPKQHYSFQQPSTADPRHERLKGRQQLLMAPALVPTSDEKASITRDSRRDRLIDEALNEEDSLGAIDLPIEPKDVGSGRKAYESQGKPWSND